MDVRCIVGVHPALSTVGERVFLRRFLGAVAFALVRCVRLLLLACALLPPVAAAAQHPGILTGRIIDGAAAAPVAGALVTLTDAARTATATTDGTGSFTVRGIEPGSWPLRVQRQGYADTALVMTIVNGRTTSVVVRLRPRPERLAGIRVAAGRDIGGSTRLERAQLERAGVRTAGDALRGVAGVVIRSTGPGGAQTASIRGSAADAVLVLIDGVAINDPVTGEADLSAVPVSQIASIEVLPGARSARFGAGAGAGVILIETRRTAATAGELSLGSLASRGVRLEAGREGSSGWSAGAAWHDADNAFDFASPAQAGGGSARRGNADATSASAFAALRAPVGGGDVQARLGAERLERGLPGRGFAPSPFARESLARLRGSVGWRRAGAVGSTTLLVAGTVQRARFRDPDPPFGLAYDDTTRIAAVEARAETERSAGAFLFGGGVDTRWQLVDATSLTDALPARIDAGAFVHAAASMDAAGGDVTFSTGARLDRDARRGEWFGSRSLAVVYTRGGITLQLANRSSYSPPTLGDQFFRESVGVAPNPALLPERVPSETELAIAARTRITDAELHARVALYDGDTRDMIVWQPDFRFTWSPRNVDVRRQGAELSAELRLTGAVRALEASYAYARTVYDDADDDTQLAYRPRHTGHVTARLAAGAWSGTVETHYTGIRYPAAARVNALPAFWTTAVSLEHSWRMGDWRLRTALRVDRILDEDDTLIFGFPEPGRVAELRIRLSHANTPATESDR